MTMYAIFPIKQPITPSRLAAYKTLRLTSLQIDPHAFTSSYAREAAFSDNVWLERLDSRFKQTFVASVPGAPSHEHRGINEDMTEAGEWIGAAKILGPLEMASSNALAPFKEAGVGADWEVYGLYGMWVHPAHRGQGVGAQLVEACLEWARNHVDTVTLSSENKGYAKKVVVLLVYDNNVAGRALYSRTGFTDLGEVSATEGQRWMLATV